MNLEEPTPNGYFCIQFSLPAARRFEMLNSVFEALRAGKSGEFTDADDPYWRTFFDADALKHFWWPTHEELVEWQRLWETTAPEERHTSAELERPWDFASMIDAFNCGDYDLIELRRNVDGSNELLFDPHGFPFGGTGCMHALITSFGGKVTGETMP